MLAPSHTSESKTHVATSQAKSLPFFQPKLTVNPPGDAHEQEADAMADQVMRMKTGDAPIVQRMPFTPVSNIQRACAACEREKEMEGVQRKESGSGDAGGKAAPAAVTDVLSSGGGQSMDGGTRHFMESRFGQDFSQVRIHTDSKAAESASAIQARAYTSGRDIVFGKGEYQPESEGGKRLLAHELVHVGQQGGGVRRSGLDADGGPDENSLPPQNQIIGSEIGPPISLEASEGNEFVTEMNQRFANIATRIIPVPTDGLTGNLSPTNSNIEESVQRFPQIYGTSPIAIQRSNSSGSSQVDGEAGVVGSIQICIDFCTGNARVVGWIWGGAGISTRLGWWGAYIFAEQEFWRGNLGFGHINCGECDSSCAQSENPGETEFAGGIAGFPIVIRPGQRASLRRAGLEVGLLITPHSRCDADLEVIALLDVLQYLGPVGAGISRFVDAANEIAERYGIEIECQLGIDGSGVIHLCRSRTGGITSDSAEICLGGYVACGIGLSHNKNALPH